LEFHKAISKATEVMESCTSIIEEGKRDKQRVWGYRLSATSPNAIFLSLVWGNEPFNDIETIQMINRVQLEHLFVGTWTLHEGKQLESWTLHEDKGQQLGPEHDFDFDWFNSE
jgi:hypothetical protein